jgi:hypothetical protein
MIDLALNESLFIYDPLDAAIQELDILFGTKNTELIGNPDYGTAFEYFLWQLTPNVDSVDSYIREKINTSTIFVRNMKYNLKVYYYTDVAENIYVVQITLYDSSNRKKDKTYFIS